MVRDKVRILHSLTVYNAYSLVSSCLGTCLTLRRWDYDEDTKQQIPWQVIPSSVHPSYHESLCQDNNRSCPWVSLRLTFSILTRSTLSISYRKERGYRVSEGQGKRRWRENERRTQSRIDWYYRFSDIFINFPCLISSEHEFLYLKIGYLSCKILFILRSYLIFLR